MNNGTTIWDLKDLAKSCNENHAQIDGFYVPARPLGWTSIPYRIKAAWLVYTGKADVVTWPGGQ